MTVLAGSLTSNPRFPTQRASALEGYLIEQDVILPWGEVCGGARMEWGRRFVGHSHSASAIIAAFVMIPAPLIGFKDSSQDSISSRACDLQGEFAADHATVADDGSLKLSGGHPPFPCCPLRQQTKARAARKGTLCASD